jgi:hypothetical protein
LQAVQPSSTPVGGKGGADHLPLGARLAPIAAVIWPRDLSSKDAEAGRDRPDQNLLSLANLPFA